MNSDGSGRPGSRQAQGSTASPPSPRTASRSSSRLPPRAPDGARGLHHELRRLQPEEAHSTTGATASSSQPDVSADGRKIVFQSDRDPHSGDDEIYAMNLDGSAGDPLDQQHGDRRFTCICARRHQDRLFEHPRAARGQRDLHDERGRLGSHPAHQQRDQRPAPRLGADPGQLRRAARPRPR